MAAAKGTTLPSFCILDSLQGVLPERAGKSSKPWRQIPVTIIGKKSHSYQRRFAGWLMTLIGSDYSRRPTKGQRQGGCTHRPPAL
ncbi:hypothetical protein YSA_06640 [Pseudomonas putida ND6]|uniref:Uncharacterized protein n=1 Tax=Pseudomonas putida ND6 TaxID=231023 RepID=I3UXX9_PSEPU|nr:hypothetical protein YSA_06640 [Pseudomonas putida ND6]